MRTMGMLVFSFLVGCGSIKTRDVNTGELSQVKKVAIASYSWEQPIPTTVALNLSSGKVEGEKVRDFNANESDEVTQSYKDIASAIGARMKWRVTPLEEMRANSTYKEWYENKMKGWQFGKAPPNHKLFNIENVMDAQSLRRMRMAEKDALMAGLGVDAIIEMKVNVVFANSGMKVMGIGSRYPQAHVMFYMWKKGVEAPVWFEGRMAGDVATESVGKTGFFDEQAVTRLGRLSAKSAFTKLNPSL